MGRFAFNPDHRHSLPQAELGERFWQGGKAYQYTHAGNNISKNSAVRINRSNLRAFPMAKSTGLTELAGVATEAFTNGQYGWVQVYGKARARTGSGCAANAQLYTSGTSGVVDDASGSQDTILKMTSSSARATTGEDANTNEVFMDFPYISNIG